VATINGVSKELMLDIAGDSVVAGSVDELGNLTFTTRDGEDLPAGNVKGPQGAPAALKITAKLVGDLPSSYPTGVTSFSFGAENPGWPVVLGTVFSYIENVARGFQIVTEKASGTSSIMWIRIVGQDAWGPFMQLAGTDASGVMSIPRLRLTAVNDASAGSTLHPFQVGPDTGANLIIDGNEIQARDNGVGKRVYMEYGANSDSALWTPTDPGDFTTRKFVDDFRKATIVQRLMTGGGVRKTTSGGISWSQRFILMGAGRGFAGGNGYYEITMPPDGTVIPMYGSTGGASVTVAGGIIPMNGWRALYYDVPFGSVQTSDPARFRMIDYTAATTQEIPPTWVLVATRNVDSLSANYIWGDGRVQDYWKLLTLTNSWSAYNTSFPAPAWRFTAEGKVETHGLMKSGTVGLSTPFATLPYPELAPDGGPNSGLIVTLTASAGPYTARIDILPDGKMVIIALGTGSTNAYVSLDNLSWHPAGH